MSALKRNNVMKSVSFGQLTQNQGPLKHALESHFLTFSGGNIDGGKEIIVHK